MPRIPATIAIINGRDDLTAATRQRRKALGISQLEVDARAGLPDGYTGKLEAALSNPTAPNARAIGWTALPLLLETLGLDLVVVPRGRVRKPIPAAESGARGGRARAKRLSPEQRREGARKAAAARWARKGC